MKRANRPSRFTSGKNKYDFIKVDELARQIAAVASQDEVTGIINCCSGEPESLADTVAAFIQDNQLSISLDYGRFLDRPYDSRGVWGDATVIRRLTYVDRGPSWRSTAWDACDRTFRAIFLPRRSRRSS